MPAPLPTCSNEEAKEAAAASLRAATQGSGSGSGSSDGGDEEREPPVEGVLSRPPLVSGRSTAEGCWLCGQGLSLL